MSIILTRFKLRRRTEAEWTALNEVLLLGEPGIETDTLQWKVGDGITAWNSLGYFNVGAGGPPSGPAGGDLGGTYPDPSVIAITEGSTSQDRLPIGPIVEGEYLIRQGDEIVSTPATGGGTLDGCRVYNNANISLTASVVTPLTFNSERYDNGGLHSTGANTSRITIITSGYYLIGGCVDFAGSGTGQAREITILLNGTTTIAAQVKFNNATTIHITIEVSCIYYLSAGDYVELTAYQNTAGALNVLASPNFSPEFWAQMITA